MRIGRFYSFAFLVFFSFVLTSCKSTPEFAPEKVERDFVVVSDLLKKNSFECDERYMEKLKLLLSRTHKSEKRAVDQKQFFDILIHLEAKELNADEGYGERFARELELIREKADSLLIYQKAVQANCTTRDTLEAFKVLLNSIKKLSLARDYQQKLAKKIAQYAGNRSRVPLSMAELNFKIYLLGQIDEYGLREIDAEKKKSLRRYLTMSKNEVAKFNRAERNIFPKGAASVSEEELNLQTSAWLKLYSDELKKVAEIRKSFDDEFSGLLY